MYTDGSFVVEEGSAGTGNLTRESLALGYLLLADSHVNVHVPWMLSLLCQKTESN
jgi:hypothetical protein